MITGSVQVKRGIYYCLINLPDRKQRAISTGLRVSDNTKRQANARLREMLNEYEQMPSGSNQLLISYLDDFMKAKKNELRGTTIEGYNNIWLGHIKPYFEHLNLKLSDINAIHIQNYITDKMAKGLSANTIHRHMAILGAALKEAYRKDLITINVMDKTTLPRRKTSFVGKTLTASQAEDLLRAFSQELIFPAVIMGVYYGLRRGECAGLRWNSFDWKDKTIKIERTITRVKTEIEDTTKAEETRTLSIVPETESYLFSLYEKRKSDKDRVCDIAPNHISHRFHDVLEANNLPLIRFHDLRHTAGSLLISSGASIKTVMEILGHKQISTTNIYLHLAGNEKQRAAELLGGVIGKLPV